MNKNIQGDMQIFMKVASCKVVKLYHTWRAIKMYEFKSAPFYKSLTILLTISWYNQMTLIITIRSPNGLVSELNNRAHRGDLTHI